LSSFFIPSPYKIRTMTIENRINAFVKLGSFFKQFPEANRNEKLEELNMQFYEPMQSLISNLYCQNQWFTPEMLLFAIDGIARNLSAENIEKWLSQYPEIKDKKEAKKIAVIMAGNIPLVGFHDFLCVLVSGNSFIGKLSSKDSDLLKLIADVLIHINPEFEKHIYFEERFINNFDAVIATGSNNSARYFDYYFGKYPHIIRKNRSSVALLTGNETTQDLTNLADDIYLYFGLGCRNVSKIYIPENFDLGILFKASEKYRYFANHNKYANNYDYNKSVYLMDSIAFLDTEFSIFKESENISSPISVTYFERYKDINAIVNKINLNIDSIQCIVSNFAINRAVSFGNAQYPYLWDYADNEDTIKFLVNLK